MEQYHHDEYGYEDDGASDDSDDDDEEEDEYERMLRRAGYGGMGSLCVVARSRTSQRQALELLQSISHLRSKRPWHQFWKISHPWSYFPSDSFTEVKHDKSLRIKGSMWLNWKYIILQIRTHN